MATRSSILAWEIPPTEEPGGLQPTGSQRVRHDWAHVCMFTGGRIGFEVNWNWRKLQIQSLSYISRAQCPQVTSGWVLAALIQAVRSFRKGGPSVCTTLQPPFSVSCPELGQPWGINSVSLSSPGFQKPGWHTAGAHFMFEWGTSRNWELVVRVKEITLTRTPLQFPVKICEHEEAPRSSFWVTGEFTQWD